MGLVDGLLGGVGDLVGGLLGGGKQTSTTPAPAQTTPAAPPPATSQQPSNPTKPTSQPVPNQPSNPTPPAPSTPQESTPAGSTPDTPANSSPGTGNSGTDGSTGNDNPSNDAKATKTNAFPGTSTSGAAPKPVVNVASPDPNIPLGQSTPGGDGQHASSALVGGGAITPGAGNVEWGTTTTDGSSNPTAGSLNDKSAANKSGFPLGAAAAIGVFGVLFALLIGLLCYRRVLLAKRRSHREQVRPAGVRDTGVDWDFRDTRTSMFSIGSVDSDSTAVMQQAVPGRITVTTANHVAVDSPHHTVHAAPYTPVSPAVVSPNTPASAGVHQPLIDIEAQAPSHVAYPYQDLATPVAASHSTRSLTAPSIVVPASSPRVSNVSAVSSINPFTLARPENPVPPLSPLYGSFEEDPFASPYDGAVPTSSKTSLALHPENPFHPERA
ncbi:hypothetical protein AURDEDRAFT_160007 [Auricularia subglabra TFB-10046 SS5]|nr:hypothetical protein AURDEDRAFT_160007 [Auricularia subglabra TFB-10046 SS5]